MSQHHQQHASHLVLHPTLLKIYREKFTAIMTLTPSQNATAFMVDCQFSGMNHLAEWTITVKWG